MAENESPQIDMASLIVGGVVALGLVALFRRREPEIVMLGDVGEDEEPTRTDIPDQLWRLAAQLREGGL